MTGISGQRKFALWTSYFLLLLLATLALGEAALRFMYREVEVNGQYFGLGTFAQDPEVGFRHAPNFDGPAYRTGSFDHSFVTDENGFRQSDVDEQAGYPKRLLVLGDSFAAGLGVEEHEAFPHLLKKDLNSIGIGVINAGQVGWGTRQSAVFGKRIAERFAVSAVLLAVFPGNDIQDDYQTTYEKAAVKWGYLLPADRPLPYWPVDFLRTHSYTWLFLDGRIFDLARRKQQVAELMTIARNTPAAIFRPTIEALLDMRDFCAVRGIWFGVTLIPQRSGYGALDEEIRRMLRAERIPYLNLGNRLSPQAHYLRNDGHWNPHGHRRAAVLLAPFLRDQLRRPDNETPQAATTG